LAGLFLVGFATVAGLAIAVAPSSVIPQAHAVGPTCLNGGDYGALSMEQVDGYTFDSRGTRSHVAVIKPDNVHCQHVSSTYVWNGSGSFEFGYLIGYSNCPGFQGHYYVHPHRFWWAMYSTGAFRGCGVFSGSVPEGTYQTFRGSDENGNYYWGAWYNGTNLQPSGVKLDFNQGMNGAGMERALSSDSGYSRFNQLSEYHDGNGWSYFDDLRVGVNRDPSYHFHEVNVHSGETVHD